MITTTADLKALCTRLSEQTHIAVDTEFMRDKTYYAKLCLIQVGSDNDEAIIDPLAKNIDLAPLLDLMRNEQILKVFHAGRQDLEIFVDLMGELPKPCYDTQIAAMVCGFGDQVGYDKLIQEMLGITIDKGSRFTDWGRRPLDKKQMVYALNDVVHLNTVFPLLRDRIDHEGRDQWIYEEMQVLADMSIYKTNPDEAWRKIKQKGSKPHILNRLKYLAAWRECEAQKRDVPKSRLIKDEILMAIAQTNPSSPSILGQVRGFPGAQNGKLISPVFKTLEKANQTPEENWPHLPMPSRHKPAPAIVEMLRVLLKHVADEANIAPRLIASAEDLDLIALGKTESVKAMSGWRYELFGKFAEAMKSGKIALSIKGSHLRLTTPGD
jgi:ribonuclease D